MTRETQDPPPPQPPPPAPRRPVVCLLVKLWIVAIPFQVILASYVYLDPFRVLHHYEQMPPDSLGELLNRDFVSTEKLLRERERRTYDSFIFGSSRSQAFLCSDWAAYLPDAHPYHYDAFGEPLPGIVGKVRLLDELGLPIKNALLIVDHKLLADLEEPTGHIYVKHPRVNRSFGPAFQVPFLKAYFTDWFWWKYILRVIDPSRLDPLADKYRRYQVYDPVTNDISYAERERDLQTDPDRYYADRADDFTRPAVATTSPEVLGERQISLWNEMAEVFRRHGTDVRIVVSPLFDQMRLSAHDREALERMFGRDHVYDFSGRNEFTADIHNYYDPAHFRPAVGREILRRIYASPLSPRKHPDETP
jgi:hypothetical protein